MECYTRADLFSEIKTCRIGLSKHTTCDQQFDDDDIQQAVDEAISWLASIRPELFSKVVTVTADADGCFFQFEDYQRVISILTIDGNKAKESEASDLDKDWSGLEGCAFRSCPDIYCGTSEPQYQLDIKSNGVFFKDNVPHGTQIQMCVVPCLNKDDCLPKQLNFGGEFYHLIKWMTVAIVLCSVNSDEIELGIADRYYKKIYDFIILKFQIDHSLATESLKFLRPTDG